MFQAQMDNIFRGKNVGRNASVLSMREKTDIMAVSNSEFHSRTEITRAKFLPQWFLQTGLFGYTQKQFLTACFEPQEILLTLQED